MLVVSKRLGLVRREGARPHELIEYVFDLRRRRPQPRAARVEEAVAMPLLDGDERRLTRVEKQPDILKVGCQQHRGQQSEGGIVGSRAKGGEA